MSIRPIAFYLPQYHPVPENDEWWGKGFTEWTNVSKARPLFKSHHQPHLPADLGFYDLRVPEVRQQQADLARSYGLHGFCYYHYWFNGRRILERPFNEVLSSGQPDFPFCLCWANENWTRRWDGQENEILLEQRYCAEDDIAHIRSLMPAFHDPRYIRIDDKPMFLVYRVDHLPEPRATAERWQAEARRHGLAGLYLVLVENPGRPGVNPLDMGFDASVEFQPRWELMRSDRILRQKWWHRKRFGTAEAGFQHHDVFDYAELIRRTQALPRPDHPRIRCVCPSWDNSARRATGARILRGATPEIYGRWLEEAAVDTQTNEYAVRNGADRLLFINAWNEWAEGNHLEPCRTWGHAYLEATRDALARAAARTSAVPTSRTNSAPVSIGAPR